MTFNPIQPVVHNTAIPANLVISVAPWIMVPRDGIFPAAQVNVPYTLESFLIATGGTGPPYTYHTYNGTPIGLPDGLVYTPMTAGIHNFLRITGTPTGRGFTRVGYPNRLRATVQDKDGGWELSAREFFITVNP